MSANANDLLEFKQRHENICPTSKINNGKGVWSSNWLWYRQHRVIMIHDYYCPYLTIFIYCTCVFIPINSDVSLLIWEVTDEENDWMLLPDLPTVGMDLSFEVYFFFLILNVVLSTCRKV